MSRVQAKDYDEKKKSILKHAALLIAQRGFDGASLTDIAKNGGISKSLLYHYFTGKGEILYEVMRRHVDELVEAVGNPAFKNDDPRVEFRNLLNGVLELYNDAEASQQVLLYELDKLSIKRRREIVSKERQIIAAFEGAYMRVFPDYRRKKEKLRTRIMLFFGMINWLHTWYNPAGAVAPKQLEEEIVNVFLGAGG